MSSQRLESVQALRGVAALMVLFFHINVFMPGSDALRILFSSGFKGVYIFFVVSGFIMAHTADKMKGAPLSVSKEFLLKRLIRIIPLYYISTLAVMIVLQKTSYFFSERPDLLLKSLLFIPSFETTTPPIYGNPILVVGWTLNYEILFYLIFSVALLFGRNRYYFMGSVFLALTVAIPLISLGEFTLNYDKGYIFQFKYLEFLTNPVLLYFLTGVIWAKVYERIKVKRSWVIIAVIVSLILFVPSYAGLVPAIPYYVADFITINLLVGSIAMMSDGNVGIKIPRFFIWAGDVSYSIYLTHLVVILVVNGIFIHKLHVSVNVWIPVIITTVLTFVVSAVSYEVFEKRITRYLRSRLTTSYNRTAEYTVSRNP